MSDALKPPFECLMESKAAVDVAHGALVKALRAGAEASEIAALLRAVELATENMRTAQHVYSQIADPPWHPDASS